MSRRHSRNARQRNPAARARRARAEAAAQAAAEAAARATAAAWAAAANAQATAQATAAAWRDLAKKVAVLPPEEAITPLEAAAVNASAVVTAVEADIFKAWPVSAAQALCRIAAAEVREVNECVVHTLKWKKEEALDDASGWWVCVEYCQSPGFFGGLPFSRVLPGRARRGRNTEKVVGPFPTKSAAETARKEWQRTTKIGRTTARTEGTWAETMR